MSNPKEFYPSTLFSFQLSLVATEEQKAAFQEVSGIDMEMNAEEVTSGGENRYKYRLPGKVEFNNLVLKRGLITKDSSLAKWVRDTIDSNMASPIQPKDIIVFLKDNEGKVLISWNFINAYPVKWKVSDFKSEDNQLAVESLEFAYTRFKKN